MDSLYRFQKDFWFYQKNLILKMKVSIFPSFEKTLFQQIIFSGEKYVADEL